MGKNIAVIGGGASGIMAALQASYAGACVEIYEKNSRVGKKILSTGNGKCNLSNADMDKKYYNGSAAAFYDDIFSEFGAADTIDFFSQRGLLIKNKNGYLYPRSEQASTVLDVLRFGLKECKIKINTDSSVEKILIGQAKNKNKLGVCISMEAAGKESIAYYDAVILACGGRAAPKSGSDGSGFRLAEDLGHNITKTVPALVQLRCKESFFKSVAGVRTQAGLTLCIDDQEKAYETGELQLTDYGISGIPVFQFSRVAAYALLHKRKVTVDIDFLPEYSSKEYELLWQERWKRQSLEPLGQFLTGIVNNKINALIVKLAGAEITDIAGNIAPDIRRKIESLYRKLTVSVCGTNGFDNAQVCAGGVPADELTNKLESKLVPNLYFAGEIIDIDGICGGYNLQWAWSSGAVAGRAAALK